MGWVGCSGGSARTKNLTGVFWLASRDTTRTGSADGGTDGGNEQRPVLSNKQMVEEKRRGSRSRGQRRVDILTASGEGDPAARGEEVGENRERERGSQEAERGARLSLAVTED